MRGVVIGLVLGVVIATAAGVFVVAPMALLHHSANPLEQAFGRSMVNLAEKFGGSGAMPSPGARQPVPGQNLGPGTVENAGRNAYTGSCAMCHGALGDGKGRFGQATFPNATDLTSADAKGKSDGDLYFIIKNGLGFTGMPSFGDQYNDNDLVDLVNYVRALQKGQGQPVAVGTPTATQLKFADMQGDDVQRGAALFFANGCNQCHGAYGDAPEELGLQDISDVNEVVRHGRPGMPVFPPSKLSDSDVKAIQAYLTAGPPDAGQ